MPLDRFNRFVSLVIFFGHFVSAQVVAFNLRSALPITMNTMSIHPCDSVVVDCSNKSIAEIDYCSVINRALPESIRVVGWCEVSPGFSSRFSAVGRMYRYFFVRKNLNIDAMQQAASHLCGEHDFRNFAKLDLANVRLFSFSIVFPENLTS